MSQSAASNKGSQIGGLGYGSDIFENYDKVNAEDLDSDDDDDDSDDLENSFSQQSQSVSHNQS